MAVETKPLVEITRDAIRVLTRELGLANTMRFIGQFTAGLGNYTEEREQLLADLTLDDIIKDIKQSKE